MAFASIDCSKKLNYFVASEELIDGSDDTRDEYVCSICVVMKKTAQTKARHD